jgi:hypothetical protein
MKKSVFILSLPVLVGLGSCGVGAAEDFVAEFHKKLDAKEYDYIVENMLDPETTAESGTAQWYEMFYYIESTWGIAESRDEAFDFQTNTSNGITSVELNYTVKFKALTIYERIFLVDRGSGFRISGLFMNESKEGLEAMQ